MTEKRPCPRLDQWLVDHGLMPTRARARDAVMRGCVTIDGRPATRPGEAVAATARVVLDDPAARYVSRAALKLIAGLDGFGFEVAGRIALDIGQSTGGFSQVLLERGARAVVGIEVGHGQLHPLLAADPRVHVLEKLNARDLCPAHLSAQGAGPPEVIVCDVSFISLRLALPPALEMAAPDAVGVFLVKPQFEAGRAAIGKGGLVDPETAVATARQIASDLDGRYGWRVVGLTPSPIQGGDGNDEFLLGARRGTA